jgi:hypothetical protein
MFLLPCNPLLAILLLAGVVLLPLRLLLVPVLPELLLLLLVVEVVLPRHILLPLLLLQTTIILSPLPLLSVSLTL